MRDVTLCPYCYIEVPQDQYEQQHVCDPANLTDAREWEQGLMAANDANPAVLKMRRSFARRRRLKKILTLGQRGTGRLFW